jgi:virginiamycin B lyase
MGITTGPDGALWFAESGADQIGRMVPGTHNMTEYAVSRGSSPERITSGPDGAVWFTEPGNNRIGEIPANGTMVMEYMLPPNSNPQGITAGPGGAVWFTEAGSDTIGRLTPDGVLTEYHAPWMRLTPSGFHAITVGADGALWFIEQGVSAIGRMTTDGTFTEYPLSVTLGISTRPVALHNAGVPDAITAGADGALWFTMNYPTDIGRIGKAGTVSWYGPHVLNASFGDITAGPDGAVWAVVNNTIGPVELLRIAPNGSETFVDTSASYAVGGITTGPDHNLWYTEIANNAIGTYLVPAIGSHGHSSTGADGLPITLGVSVTPRGGDLLGGSGRAPINSTGGVPITVVGTVTLSGGIGLGHGHSSISADGLPLTDGDSVDAVPGDIFGG